MKNHHILLLPWLMIVVVKSDVDTDTGFLRDPSPRNSSYNNNGTNTEQNVTDIDNKEHNPDDSPGQCDTSCNNRCPSFVFLTGQQGPPGPEGPRGLPGPIGQAGSAGNNGHNGYPGVCHSVMGPKGNEGQSGRTGRTGNKGEPGLPGAPGNDGPQGPVGENGTAGVCIPGKLGLKGDMGHPGLPGQAGEKGDTGESGHDALCGPEQCRAARPEIRNVRQRRAADAGPNKFRARFSAFSVSRYGEMIASYSDEIITWDYEFINAGGDFDIDRGIYNCSIPGYYFFTFSIYKSSITNYPLVQLMLNGDVQVSIIDADFWDSEDSSSNSVILELGFGDLVWLQLAQGRVIHSGYYRFTTFSGTLIHKLI